MQIMTIDQHIKHLLDSFDVMQYNHKANLDFVKGMPIMSREELQQTKMEKGAFSCKSSGSTGIPVTVEKTILDHIWYMATNIREMKWRNWNFGLTKATVKPSIEKEDKEFDSWGIPKIIAPNQGKSYKSHLGTVKEIQEWLEKRNPHYLHCNPTVAKQLDLKKISNLIDVKGTGELGGSMYSSEECGTIALQCPTNKDNYHVMENQLVETNENKELIITTLTNPYIRRYKHGDLIELGSCNCGRSLQTITKIYGRVRNMFVYPNGDKKWPLFGSRTYYDDFGIKRFKLIQHSLVQLELQVVCEKMSDENETRLKEQIRSLLETQSDVSVTYVDNFTDYKHEEFVSFVKSV